MITAMEWVEYFIHTTRAPHCSFDRDDLESVFIKAIACAKNEERARCARIADEEPDTMAYGMGGSIANKIRKELT